MYSLYKILTQNLQIKVGDLTNNSKLNQGFALLEVVIALIVVGIISGVSLPLLKKVYQINKTKTSERHVHEIENAILAYARKHKNIPCPAPKNNPGFAVNKCSKREAIGIVPYKTLGLAEKYSRDGNGRYFVYVIDPEVNTREIISSSVNRYNDSITNTPIDDEFYNDPGLNVDVHEEPGLIKIKDHLGHDVVDYTKTKIAYIIIENIDIDNSNNLSRFEKQNLKKDFLFFDYPLSNNKKHLFRQRLYWYTLDNLANKLRLY